jgi:hypothetical protein
LFEGVTTDKNIKDEWVVVPDPVKLLLLFFNGLASNRTNIARFMKERLEIYYYYMPKGAVWLHTRREKTVALRTIFFMSGGDGVRILVLQTIHEPSCS